VRWRRVFVFEFTGVAEIGPQEGVLAFDPASGDVEREPLVGEVVEVAAGLATSRGSRWGQDEDAGRESDRLRVCGDSGERGEALEQVPEGLGFARREQDVVAGPQRGVAEGLGPLGDRGDRVAGAERTVIRQVQSDLHGQPRNQVELVASGSTEVIRWAEPERTSLRCTAPRPGRVRCRRRSSCCSGPVVYGS
jgi:hypothetical protein